MKLLHSFKKDMTLALRGMYFYIEVIFALVFVVIMVFVVPENFNKNLSMNLWVDLPDGPLKERIVESVGTMENMGITNWKSLGEVKTAMEENRSSIGLVIAQEKGKITYQYILQGYESKKLRNMLQTTLESQFVAKMPGFTPSVTAKALSSRDDHLSDRLTILPIYLMMNAGFIALFIIAAYVFLDKEEGTIKAYSVAPTRMHHYLLSKAGVMMVTGTISGLFCTLALAGVNANYLFLFPLIISTNFFGSALGLLISSFFDNMTKAMGWLYVSVIIMGMASISYYQPAFSPWYIKMLPSYPMVYLFREVLLPSPEVLKLTIGIGGFLGAGILLFLFALARFKKTLTV